MSVYVNASLLSRPRERTDRSHQISVHLRGCEHSCVLWYPVIRTKSYYPRIHVCKCRRLQFGFVHGGDRSFSRATSSLFMEHSNLWLFIFAVFVECLFVEFHCTLKKYFYGEDIRFFLSFNFFLPILIQFSLCNLVEQRYITFKIVLIGHVSILIINIK